MGVGSQSNVSAPALQSVGPYLSLFFVAHPAFYIDRAPGWPNDMGGPLFTSSWLVSLTKSTPTQAAMAYIVTFVTRPCQSLVLLSLVDFCKCRDHC
jgi:hypothetical protein